MELLSERFWRPWHWLRIFLGLADRIRKGEKKGTLEAGAHKLKRLLQRLSKQLQGCLSPSCKAFRAETPYFYPASRKERRCYPHLLLIFLTASFCGLFSGFSLSFFMLTFFSLLLILRTLYFPVVTRMTSFFSHVLLSIYFNSCITHPLIGFFYVFCLFSHSF